MRMLHNTIRQVNPRTITVDIFDTVLLRKTYPEELQFLEHAKHASRILNAHWKTETSPFIFYSFRQYVRRTLGDMQYARTGERETRIREIFAETLECIAQNASMPMSPKERDALVEKLMEAELLVERRSLRLNRRLVAALRTWKTAGLRLYFVSDMYLETADIEQLLAHFGCADLFDGGISSANAGFSKGGGMLFSLLEEHIPGFDAGKNLHIGDNFHADCAAPRKQGMATLHLRSFHTLIRRPLLCAAGTCKRKCILRMQKRGVRRTLHFRVPRPPADATQEQQTLHEIGTILGTGVLAYLAYLDLYARAAKQTVFFVSREAPTLLHLSNLLGSRNTMQQMPTLNRLQALRQFLYLGLTKTNPRDAAAILWAALLGERHLSAANMLKRMGIAPEELPLPQAFYKEIPAFVHMQGIAQLLREEPRLMRSLREAHEEAWAALEECGFFTVRKALIADVGWNGTIQSLLAQTAALMESTMEIRGVYLGCTGLPLFPGDARRMYGVLFNHVRHPLADKLLIEEIWEYALCDTEEEHPSQKWILSGIESVFRAYRGSAPASPDFLLESALPQLIRLFCRPTRAQVAALAHIPNEMRLGAEPTRPLVDLSHSHVWVLHNLFRYPARFRNLCTAQFWQNGFISWHRLRPFLPLIAMQQRFLRSRQGKNSELHPSLSLRGNRINTDRQRQRMFAAARAAAQAEPETASPVASSRSTMPRSR